MGLDLEGVHAGLVSLVRGFFEIRAGAICLHFPSNFSFLGSSYITNINNRLRCSDGQFRRHRQSIIQTHHKFPKDDSAR